MFQAWSSAIIALAGIIFYEVTNSPFPRKYSKLFIGLFNDDLLTEQAINCSSEL
jgi:hypothetical protein